MNINHVHIPVTDLSRAIAFYRDAIGLTLGFHSDAMADFSEAGLVLDQLPAGEMVSPGLIVGLAVVDVDETYAELHQRGVVADGPPTNQPWGVRNFYISDPDGNQLEFEHPTS